MQRFEDISRPLYSHCIDKAILPSKAPNFDAQQTGRKCPPHCLVFSELVADAGDWAEFQVI